MLILNVNFLIYIPKFVQSSNSFWHMPRGIWSLFLKDVWKPCPICTTTLLKYVSKPASESNKLTVEIWQTSTKLNMCMNGSISRLSLPLHLEQRYAHMCVKVYCMYILLGWIFWFVQSSLITLICAYDSNNCYQTVTKPSLGHGRKSNFFHWFMMVHF